MLAGETPSDEWKRFVPSGFRCHLRMGEESLLERVCRVAAEATGTPPLVLAHPEVVAGQRLPEGTRRSDPGSTISGNLARLRELSISQPYLLILSSDLPFIESRHLRELIQFHQQSDPPAEGIYPAVEVELCRRRFPGLRRTTVPLDGKRLTGGNVFILRRDRLDSLLTRLEAFLRARKNPLRMALLIGPGVLFRAILGRLTSADLKGQIRRLFGVRAELYLSPYPEIATDVDRVEQWERILELSAGSASERGPAQNQ